MLKKSAILAMGLAISTGAWAMHDGTEHSTEPGASFPLAGTWTLVAADVLLPDGSRHSDYGAAPKGLLIVDHDGQYSLQILKAERPLFAAGDKKKGTPQEYELAVLGSSTHYGQISIDEAAHKLTFSIKGASFPNWEGREQSRSYELVDGTLSYQVPPRPNGDIPISVWHRE